MKNRIYSLLSLLLVVSGFVLSTSCSESLKIDTTVQGDPVITGFEPTSGKAGTEVTVTGENFRDVLSASIGGVDAPLRYIISQQTAVIVVPGGAKNGKIAFKTKEKEAQSEANFTMVYPQPSLTTTPTSGKVDEEVEFRGSNLDVVQKIYFKDVEATVISYKSEKELVVKVPFVSDDRVDIRLTYFNEQGEQSMGTTGNAFEILKTRPTISGTLPNKLTEGETVTLNGENLNLIEKITFGEVEATISRKEATILSFRVPTLPETSTVKVTAYYYEETATLTLSEACEVFIPKVFFYPNLMQGSHRNAEFGNMLNATAGQVLPACVLKDQPAQSLIDFASVVNSNYDFALNGPHNTVNGIRNYWCEGKSFITSNTLDGLIAEGYGDFMTTKTLFLVLLRSNEVQAEIINKVVNGQLDELSPETTPTLFNGTIVADKNSVRSRRSTEAEDTEADNIYKVGSVILFKNEKKNKIGLLYIKEVNVAYGQPKTHIDANSSIVFDVYYQR